MVPFRIRLLEYLRYRLFPFSLICLERIEERLVRGFMPSGPSSTSPIKKKSALILFLGTGGGADKQALADAKALEQQGYTITLLAFQVLRRRFVLYTSDNIHGAQESFYAWQMKKLWRRLDDLSFSEARLHHVRYWPQYVAQALPDYFASRKISITLNLHDFYYICPRVHLLNGDYLYCDLPENPSVCDACIEKSGRFVNLNGNVAEWRAQNSRLLQSAANIIAPSQDTIDHYHKIFPELTITAQPHETLAQLPAPTNKSTCAPLHIAVVGNLQRYKGADIVLAAAQYIKSNKIPIVITVIGDSAYAPEFAALGVQVTGKYEATELPRSLAEAKAQYVWLASPWPETYSFVLSEIWQAGYPAIAFDMGAPAERIRLRNSGTDVILANDLIDNIPELCHALAGTGARVSDA